MSLSTPFIHRPVATTLLTIAIFLAGALAYFYLPVAPLPQVDFPTVSVGAQLPGASPETMASAVAAPLERQFGRIAGVTEMTSTSFAGNASITLQFDLGRNIDAACRDVQAAINAARGELPTNLPSNPTYRKVNPADPPIMILAITSPSYDRAQMYDVAASILQQKISQMEGVGQVMVGGASPPAVRVEVNPMRLNSAGLSLEDVRTTLANANANRPKGQIENERRAYTVTASDQLYKARQYEPLIITSRKGSPVVLKNVATVSDSLEDLRTAGMANAQPSVQLLVFRQPGANMIATFDRVAALLPQLQAEIPADMKLSIVMDRTATVRSGVRDVQIALLVSLVLVILVVLLFLRNFRTTFIPGVVVPVSLVATFGVMYLCHYSIDNLSLMALTVATGFVVDDAIVVIENITRHIEAGMPPLQAALRGAREIGFTVLSISVSLIAVFIPILMMGGIVGRIFREFAVVLSVAVTVSLIVSLTTTPMMCAKLLKGGGEELHGGFYRFTEWIFNGVLFIYEWTLTRVLRHPLITLLITLSTIGFTVYLYAVVPKGFFPQQDTGRLIGTIMADQDISFQSMNQLLTRYCEVVGDDEDVTGINAFVGGNWGGPLNTGRMFVMLRPIGQRRISADEVMRRLRGKCAQVPGGMLIFSSIQDVRIGGRLTSAQYQLTLQADNLADLKEWAPKVASTMQTIPGLVDVQSDQQDRGLSATLVIDRATAARMGVTPAAIDNTLYDAYGQRQVSTIYNAMSQNHVVMEVDPSLSQGPPDLRHIYVAGAAGKLVPLSEIAHYSSKPMSLAVNHTGQFPSITISFNLNPGVPLGDAVAAVEQAEHDMGLPVTIHGNFSGAAQAYQDSIRNQPMLIIAALLTVYIVLGILYESYIHPITIISTLPSAGVGALLALILCKTELNVMGLIGIILLIGIVKKNAIMMVDFALDAERREGKSPKEAIFEACLLRFRPIIMTTLAALLGAMPLALGGGTGAEMRKPLGIAIVGGLIFSQILTLYTTPVVYLYLDRFSLWLAGGEKEEAAVVLEEAREEVMV